MVGAFFVVNFLDLDDALTYFTYLTYCTYLTSEICLAHSLPLPHTRLSEAVKAFFPYTFMSALTSYITESIAELRHVQWPTQQQAVRLTVIVIAFIAVNAAVFGLVDFGISKFISVTL